MDPYKSNKRKSESSAENWEENDAKGYNLVLQNCPTDLEAELKNQDAWGEVENTRSVVRLLTLIQDLQYNKTNRKCSIMAKVEADFELFTGFQKKNQSTDAYYKVFTSTVDTINANGGTAGWHPKLFKIHREATMEMQEMVIAQMDGPASAEERIRIEEEASELACAEYIACLFLLLADDERFKTLKKTINNNFLLGRQDTQRKSWRQSAS